MPKMRPLQSKGQPEGPCFAELSNKPQLSNVNLITILTESTKQNPFSRVSHLFSFVAATVVAYGYNQFLFYSWFSGSGRLLAGKILDRHLSLAKCDFFSLSLVCRDWKTGELVSISGPGTPALTSSSCCVNLLCLLCVCLSICCFVRVRNVHRLVTKVLGFF